MTKAEEFLAAQNQIKEYDRKTRELELNAMKFDDVYNEHFTLPEIVLLLRKAFKEGVTRYKVLGKTAYELYEQERVYNSDGVPTKRDPATDFCKVSSYLIYSMTGGEKFWELHGTPIHWWLYHKKTHLRFDITYTQFDTKTLNDNYFLGKNVKQLNTDEMLWNELRARAKTLAERAGLE